MSDNKSTEGEKGGPYCPYCEGELQKSAMPYCQPCKVTTFNCPKCHRSIPRDERKCPYCGTSIKA